MFKDKVVVITGGTGSFGQHILRGFLSTDVAEIRIFSRDEKKQEEMRTAFNNSRLKFYIGDVRAYDSIHQALKGAHYVFHAAALKQVPSCEFYPLEAVRTNVLGTENVMSAAIANNVEKVVVLSTDKAVYPINAMGQTKALMEKVMVAKARQQSPSETLLCATRYGNVMVSRGSVIPLFVQQIKAGKPLTVTDPNMTRFLMSLDDSVELVLHAYEHGQQGDIFVQKAPAATIADLVQALKEIFKAEQSGPDRRHAAWREALRITRLARGDGPSPGHGAVLPDSRPTIAISTMRCILPMGRGRFRPSTTIRRTIPSG